MANINDLEQAYFGGGNTNDAAAAFFARTSKTVLSSSDTTGATDSVNIQNAINALKGVGGVVKLSGQQFYTNTTLLLYPGIGLIGDGPLGVATPVAGSSNLSGVVALNAPIIQMQLDPSNLTWASFPLLANLTITGLHANTSQDGIVVSDTAGLLLDAYVYNVGVFDVGGNGLNLTSGCKLWINNFYAEHCQQNGVRNSGGTLRITQAYIFGNVLFGIDGTSGAYSMISNCVLGNNGQSGTANAVGGIKIGSTGSGALITSNDLFDNGTSTGQAVRITTQTSSANILIGPNHFKDTRGAGAVPNFIVTSDSGAVNGIITGNSFVGQSGKAVLVKFNNANENVHTSDNLGFNPYGVITTPISTVNNTFGLVGTTSTPVASVDYTILQTDQWVVSTGGTGVSITIKEPGGTALQSALATFSGLLPQGFKINFGAFSVAPTVASYGN